MYAGVLADHACPPRLARVLDDFATEDSRSDPRARQKPRGGRRFLIVVASLLALVLVAGGGFAFFLNQKVSNNITHEDLLPTTAATSADGKPVPLEGVGQNYLIIGSDARPGDTASRSDVIVLVHVPEDKKAVQLVHFPRDLYVQIPGRKKDKINAAYAYGGAPLLVDTLQTLLGVKIDHVAKTDFEGFKNMTDAISRGRRQQAFIKALMLKTLTPSVIANPITLTKFVEAATSNLVVDNGLSVGSMRSEAISLRNLRSGDIVFITAPFNGFGTAPDGGSIDILDEPGMAALGKALRTDTMDDYADATVTP